MLACVQCKVIRQHEKVFHQRREHQQLYSQAKVEEQRQMRMFLERRKQEEAAAAIRASTYASTCERACMRVWRAFFAAASERASPVVCPAVPLFFFFSELRKHGLFLFSCLENGMCIAFEFPLTTINLPVLLLCCAF